MRWIFPSLYSLRTYNVTIQSALVSDISDILMLTLYPLKPVGKSYTGEVFFQSILKLYFQLVIFLRHSWSKYLFRIQTHIFTNRVLGFTTVPPLLLPENECKFILVKELCCFRNLDKKFIILNKCFRFFQVMPRPPFCLFEN